MYLGELGQGSTGERFRVTGGLGKRPVQCPPGTQTLTTGRWPSGGTYADCWRAPQFAPPATTTVTYEAPRTTTTVSPAIQTAVSPQISPTLAQQQASPGAGVTARPAQTAGGQGAETGYRPGLTGEQVMMMLESERRAREAEAAAQRDREGLERAQRQQELTAFRDAYDRQAAASAETMQREIDAQAARQAAIDMADTEAQVAAQESALYIPPPPSMIPLAPPMVTSPTPEPMTSTPPAAQVAESGTPWGMIMLAVAAVGIVAAGAAGKRKRKR